MGGFSPAAVVRRYCDLCSASVANLGLLAEPSGGPESVKSDVIPKAQIIAASKEAEGHSIPCLPNSGAPSVATENNGPVIEMAPVDEVAPFQPERTVRSLK